MDLFLGMDTIYSVSIFNTGETGTSWDTFLLCRLGVDNVRANNT